MKKLLLLLLFLPAILFGQQNRKKQAFYYLTQQATTPPTPDSEAQIVHATVDIGSGNLANIFIREPEGLNNMTSVPVLLSYLGDGADNNATTSVTGAALAKRITLSEGGDLSKEITNLFLSQLKEMAGHGIEKQAEEQVKEAIQTATEQKKQSFETLIEAAKETKGK